MRSSPQNETLVEVYRQSRDRRLGDLDRSSQAMIRFNQQGAHGITRRPVNFARRKASTA
jgi:hypothetical protein